MGAGMTLQYIAMAAAALLLVLYAHEKGKKAAAAPAATQRRQCHYLCAALESEALSVAGSSSTSRSTSETGFTRPSFMAGTPMTACRACNLCIISSVSSNSASSSSSPPSLVAVVPVPVPVPQCFVKTALPRRSAPAALQRRECNHTAPHMHYLKAPIQHAVYGLPHRAVAVSRLHQAGGDCVGALGWQWCDGGKVCCCCCCYL